MVAAIVWNSALTAMQKHHSCSFCAISYLRAYAVPDSLSRLLAPWQTAASPVYNSYQQVRYLRRGRCLSIKLNL